MICQSCGCHLHFDNNHSNHDLDAGQSNLVTVDTFLSNLNLDEATVDDERSKIRQSFVLLSSPESHPGPVSPTSNADVYNALEHIIEVASQTTLRDLPLCSVCTGNICNEQTKKIQELESERDAFLKVLKSFESNVCDAELGLNDDQDEFAFSSAEETLKEQETQLVNKIKELTKKKRILQEELESLERESSNVQQLEEEFWKQYRQMDSSLFHHQFETEALAETVSHTEQELEQLKKCNVFDDAFHIYYDGHFATINGFRLGRLPSQPVDWSEINAALGQVVLLLDTIAKRTKGFAFSKYELIPKGSFSKMGVKGDKNTYEMYGSSDLSLGKLWWYRRFDSAMIKFAACVKEYCEFAEKHSGSKIMQYPIEDDMINDVSLKLQFNSEAKWTKALKFLVINLKYAVAWCAKQSELK